MSRPIKETPILTGQDAERFVNEMRRVERLSKEERSANRRKLLKDYEEAKQSITICL